MSVQRLISTATDLGEREIGVIAATDQVARDGHVLEPSGINLSNYRRNPIVLWSHDPEQPVGACTAVAVEDGALAARIQFAPEGTSATADEICSLVKSGIVKGVSIGFDPLEAEPLDPALGSRGGLRILSSELLEISLVSVGADTGAAVVARSFSARPGAQALLRGLRSLPSHAVERALARIATAPRVPLVRLSAQDQAALDRRHTRVAWAAGQARDVEQRERYGYEQRQADLHRLSGARTH